MTIERLDPPDTGDERAQLRAWLEYHRTTLLMKCDGLGPDQLAARPIAPSMMSLHGLVRHLADVERNWFRRWIEGVPVEGLYWNDEHPDGEFELADGTTWDQDLAAWRAEVEHARAVEAAVVSLDEVRHREGRDNAYDVRWILLHMIEEYARHNGHADLLRELVDGTVGD